MCNHESKAVITCLVFSRLSCSRLNHSAYTTLEYNTVISRTGIIPPTKNHVRVYALRSHSLCQSSTHVLASLSKYIVKKRGMLRIAEEIHETGIITWESIYRKRLTICVSVHYTTTVLALTLIGNGIGIIFIRSGNVKMFRRCSYPSNCHQS